MEKKLRVLFLCTANASRSQMAEGWARCLKSDVIEPFSAGVDPKCLNPLAVKAMADAGVDISRQRAKHVSEVMALELDYVVTLCDNARETCPVFPGLATTVHVGFDDPYTLTLGMADGKEKLKVYVRVRDEIRDFIDSLPQAFKWADGQP